MTHTNTNTPGDYTSGRTWDDDAHEYLMTNVIEEKLMQECLEEQILEELAAEEEKHEKYEIPRRQVQHEHVY